MMKNKNDNNEGAILKYLDNRMDSREKRGFEDNMESDAALKKEVLFQNKLRLMMGKEKEVGGMIWLDGVISGASGNPPPPKTGGGSPIWNILLVGVFTVMASVGTWLYFSPSEEYRVAEKHTEVGFDLVFNLPESAPAEFKGARDAYEKGDFKKAAALFGAYLKKVPDDINALLYRGISLVETGEYDMAKKPLARVLELDERGTDNKSPARKYLAACFLVEKDYPKALGQLDSLLNHSYFKEEAKLFKSDIEGRFIGN